MKKFCLLLAAVAALTLFTVGSTSAYFTDSVTTTNVITSGNIRIRQYEQQRSGSGLVPFKNDQVALPLVQEGTAATEDVNIAGHTVAMRDDGALNYIDKIVTVKNTGINPAYLRTFVAVPTAGIRSSSPEGENWLRWDRNDNAKHWDWMTNDQWNMIDDVLIGGVEYDIYVATYDQMLLPGFTTEPSLLGFYLDSQTNYDGEAFSYINGQGQLVQLDQLENLEILVATQATQTTTFDNASDALNAIFGVPDANNHPWNNAFIHNQTELDAAIAKAEAGQTLRLENGSYTLPQTLPAGVRIVGHGDVTLSCSALLDGAGVTFHNVTFSGDVRFQGSGEFNRVHFLGSFEATFRGPVDFIGCDFESVPVWTVADAAYQDKVVFDDCTGWR